MTTSLQTLRIPRGLWADLEQTVIHQDRQFLREVAKTLGLPVNDVIKKCLGTSGAQTQLLVLMGSDLSLSLSLSSSDDEESKDSEKLFQCPWYVNKGSSASRTTLWTQCSRVRLTESSACVIHQNAVAGPSLCLKHDVAKKCLPTMIPVQHKGSVYWWCPTDPTIPVCREDGSSVPSLSFRYIQLNGEQIIIEETNKTNKTTKQMKSKPSVK